jgi:hypothetical protein
MNTEHDVWNLVWKLDLFLHGHGNAGCPNAVAPSAFQ